MRPTLYVLAGPNGAGKTTFYHAALSKLTDAEFVNADALALAHFGHVAVTAEESQTGQNLAATRMEELLSSGGSLVVESTFSHPSKLELIAAAKVAGYRVVVFHINVRTAEHAVRRVAERVSHGGHPVPEDRLRARYIRNQSLIRQAVIEADWAYVFDSSMLGAPPVQLLAFTKGRNVNAVGNLPTWASDLYGQYLT